MTVHPIKFPEATISHAKGNRESCSMITEVIVKLKRGVGACQWIGSLLSALVHFSYFNFNLYRLGYSDNYMSRPH